MTSRIDMDTTMNHEGIDDSLENLLLLAVTPEMPSDAVAAKIRLRVDQRIREHEHAEKLPADTPHASRAKHQAGEMPPGSGMDDIRFDEGWQFMAKKADMKVLFDDGKTRSFLVRLAPGAELPSHDHEAGPEECLVMAGDLWLNGIRLSAGDFQLAMPGSMHHTTRSESGCLLHVRSPSPSSVNGHAGAG